MSALLKKKYCSEQSGLRGDDESNGMCFQTVENSDDIVLVSAAVSLPSSPVSITTSSDEESALSSSVKSIETDETADCCTTSSNGVIRKSVRFSDNDEIFMDKEYSEKVHKYRANIWYTREEYRTFWNDRMNSVKLWKCLFDDNMTHGVSGAYSDFVWDGKEYTARGLENYIFSSSEEMNRQRDIYTVVVLKDPYDADRVFEDVQDMSIASLKRAQSYALQDFIDASRDFSKEPNFDRNGNIRNRSSSSTPAGSPTSVLSRNIFHHIKTPTMDLSFGTRSIQEMNKRLINGHLNTDIYLGHTTEQKKLKRRPSTSESSLLVHHSNPAFAKRRRSISYSANAYRDPVSLEIRDVPQMNQQRRRSSMTDDFNQHMQFCNRLLNDLPKVDHGPYRCDSLSLTGSIMEDSFAWNYSQGSANRMNLEDEYILQQQMRRDSLYGSRKRLSVGLNADIISPNIDSRPTSGASLNTIYPSNGAPYTDKCALLQQMILKQQQTSLSDSALNEYVNCIRSYSRLRRDSLGGNVGL